jgi:glucokinase
VLVAGADVGGTNIMVGVVDDDHEVVERRKRPTPDGALAVVNTILSMVLDLEHRPDALGVGVPGIVHQGRVLALPNLDGWSPEMSIVDELADRLEIPVAVENDAQVGLLGEWVAGVARGHDDVLGVWMGTGIGSGLVLGGRPFSGAHGTAGEFGHVIVHPDGALCGCGKRGCVEAYAGRRMMGEAVRRLEQAGRSSDLFEIMERKGKPRPTSAVWRDALEEGDEVASEVFEEGLQVVGIGLASTINLLDPGLVVLGGGLAEKLGQSLADRVAEYARPLMHHADAERPILVAGLGDDSGVVGAAWVARRSVLGG